MKALGRLFLLAAVVTVSGLVAGPTAATPGAAITATILSHAVVAEDFSITVPSVLVTKKRVRVKTKNGYRTKIVTVKKPYNKVVIACTSALGCDLVVQQGTIQPGGHTGWHHHPGPTYVSIVSGEGTLYHGDRAGCPSQKFGAGKGFEAGLSVHLLKNEGTQPVVFYAFYVLPVNTANTAIRVDDPAPAACPAVG